MKHKGAYRTWLTILASAVLAVEGHGDSETPVREAAERFFQNYEFRGFDLSPDGSHLSMIIHKDDYDSLGTYDVAKDKLHTASGTSGQTVYSYRWIDGDHLLTSLGQWGVYYVGMYVGDEDLKDFRAVGSKISASGVSLDPNQGVLRVLDPLPTVPGIALLADATHSKFYPETAYYHLKGNKLVRGKKPDFNDDGWICDNSGTIRFVRRRTSPGKYQWYHRTDETQDWEKVVVSATELRILDFDATGQRVFAVIDRALNILDLNSGEMVGKPVTHPVYSCHPALLRDRETDTVVGLVYFWDKPKVVYFDPDYQAIHAKIQARFPGATCRILGVSQRQSIFFEVSSDVEPDSIYEWSFGPTKDLKRILNQAPWNDPEDCQPMEPISCPTRDEKTVYGYLTRARAESDRSGPTVMLVHGGPFSRDSWGFDREVQFLARLGYHVIQVNFRGSTGFNSGYSMKEDQQNLLWTCEKSITDVADAARWAIDEGIADPNRIAIMGASFGGYAALAGAAFEPDLFKVAVGYAGVYDFDRELKTDYVRQGRAKDWLEPMIGDIKKDPNHYKAVSPVHFADQIQARVLLIHGSADQVVGARQSKKMSQALKKAGKPHELKITNWGVHGNFHKKERIEHGVLVGEFLREHL